MSARKLRPGFTLIELLVAITISVLLLSILAQVFKLATQATRDANTRIAITERLRALNIRMRQEFGNMLNIPRPSARIPNMTYDTDANGSGSNGTYITFSTSTDEDGYPVNVDVKYIYMPGKNAEDGKLVRRRDATGPYTLDSNGQMIIDASTKAPRINASAALGDNRFFEDGQAAESTSESTVIMTNVRACTFRIIDAPLKPTDAALQSLLNPRTLPAAVEMTLQYGPDIGAKDRLEWTKITFPIYKGL